MTIPQNCMENVWFLRKIEFGGGASWYKDKGTNIEIMKQYLTKPERMISIPKTRINDYAKVSGLENKKIM